MSLKQMQLLDGASAGKQEPIRIMGFDCVCGRRMTVSAEQGVVPAPQRTWVGLTDEEMLEAIKPLYANPFLAHNALEVSRDEYQAIEAKLKELNS